jgi:hypothetical protein
MSRQHLMLLSTCVGLALTGCSAERSQTATVEEMLAAKCVGFTVDEYDDEADDGDAGVDDEEEDAGEATGDDLEGLDLGDFVGDFVKCDVTGGEGGDGACAAAPEGEECAADDQPDPRAAPPDLELAIVRMNAAAARLAQAIDLPGWQRTYTYMMGGPRKVVFGLSKRQLVSVMGYLPIYTFVGPPAQYITDAATFQQVADSMEPRDFTTVYAGNESRQYRFMSGDDMDRILQKSNVQSMGFTNWSNVAAKENASDDLLAQFDLDGCVGWKFDDSMLRSYLQSNYPGSIIINPSFGGFPSPKIWDPANNVSSGWDQAAVVICRRNQAATGFILREVQENIRGQRDELQVDESDGWKNASRAWVVVYAENVPLLDGVDRPFADRGFKAAENTIRGHQIILSNYAHGAAMAAMAQTPLLGTALAVAEGNWGTAFGRFLLDVATFTAVGRGATAVLSFTAGVGGVLVMYIADRRACAPPDRDVRVVAARGGWVEDMRVLAHGHNRFPCRPGVAADECQAARAGVADINAGVQAVCAQPGLDAGTQAACNARVGHFPMRDWRAELNAANVQVCAPGDGV